MIKKGRIKKGRFCAEKVQYPDGIGGCIWCIINKKTPDTGLCWDFDYKDLDLIIGLLKELKTLKPRIYKEKKKCKSMNSQ
jgi:hypothetical protein